VCHMRRISIVIVTYESSDTIAECLEALLTQNCEVIVVDNSSNDKTNEIVGNFSGVELIASPTNLGFNGGNQLGYEHATGGIINFLNPDTIPGPTYVSDLQGSFDKHPKAGIIGTRINDENGATVPICSTFPSLTSLIHEHTRFRKVTKKAYEHFRYAGWDRLDSRSVDAVCGASFSVRRNVLELIGGLDTNYFLYFEEYDLCKRVKAAGYDVFYDSSIQVIHKGGVSTGQLGSKYIENIYFQSRDRYIRKFHSFLFGLTFRLSLRLSRTLNWLAAVRNKII